MKSRLRRARRIALAVGAGLPVALTAAAFVVMIVVLPQVPDPAATHWAVDGSADGFAPAHTYLWMLLGMGLALPVGMTAAMLAATHNNWGITPRMLASVSAALATFSAVSMPGSLWIQRGLVDASAAPSVLPVLFAALGAGVVVGTLAWLMQPALRLLPGVEAAPAGEVRLRPGEHVAWVGTATIARSGIVVLGIGLGILLVLTVVLAGSPAGWIVLVTTVVVGALVVSSATIRVRIGRSGLAVRSPLGWPKFALPLDEIARGRPCTSRRSSSSVGGAGAGDSMGAVAP